MNRLFLKLLAFWVLSFAAVNACKAECTDRLHSFGHDLATVGLMGAFGDAVKPCATDKPRKPPEWLAAMNATRPAEGREAGYGYCWAIIHARAAPRASGHLLDCENWYGNSLAAPVR